MILFELADDVVDGELIYWLGSTEVLGNDKEHQNQIYEQLDAELVFNL